MEYKHPQKGSIDRWKLTEMCKVQDADKGPNNATKPTGGPFGNHTSRPLSQDPRYNPDPRPLQWSPAHPVGRPVPPGSNAFNPEGDPNHPSIPKKGK